RKTHATRARHRVIEGRKSEVRMVAVVAELLMEGDCEHARVVSRHLERDLEVPTGHSAETRHLVFPAIDDEIVRLFFHPGGKLAVDRRDTGLRIRDVDLVGSGLACDVEGLDRTLCCGRGLRRSSEQESCEQREGAYHRSNPFC